MGYEVNNNHPSPVSVHRAWRTGTGNPAARQVLGRCDALGGECHLWRKDRVHGGYRRDIPLSGESGRKVGRV